MVSQIKGHMTEEQIKNFHREVGPDSQPQLRQGVDFVVEIVFHYKFLGTRRGIDGSL